MHQVTVKSMIDLQQEVITSSGHKLVVDRVEPSKLSAGPGPFELLLGALGT